MDAKQRKLIDYFNDLPDPQPPAYPAVEEGLPVPAPLPLPTAAAVRDRLERTRSMEEADEEDAEPRHRRPAGPRRWQPPLDEPITDRVIAVAAAAVEKARNDLVMTETEEIALEQLILPGLRPVIDVVNGDMATPPAGWEFLADYRPLIQRLLPSIGRIDAPGLFPRPYAGTGFLVGDGLLLTNRHVAALFVRGVGRGTQFLSFRSDLGTCLDPQYEVGDPDPGVGSVRYEVIDALLVHPHWDAAVLKVRTTDDAPLPRPLPLARRPPPQFGGGAMPNVIVVGYPALDETANNVPEQMNVFRGIFQRKRLAPGFLRGFADVPTRWGATLHAATHDASTLGGNSGSAVVDLATGDVVALHFGGRYLEANYAVPTWELALDSNVTDLGVLFRDSAGAAEPLPAAGPWIESWNGVTPLVA
jgi:endonuclease G